MGTKVLIHIAHIHVLERNKDGTEFICNGCNEKGNKGKYECTGCGFYLHAPCAKAPKILKKCSKHDIDGHHMELNYIDCESSRASSSSPLHFLTCKSCGAVMTSGLFYRCMVCFLTLHMACAAKNKGPMISQPKPPKHPVKQQQPAQSQKRPRGRKREIAKRIGTGLLLGTSIVALKGAITIATGGMYQAFDGSELGNFLPDFSDLFGGGGETYQDYGTDGYEYHYDGAGEDDEFDKEFDFGCDGEEVDLDNYEDWEYNWK